LSYPTIAPISKPSQFPTERPTFAQGTVCITVSIVTVILQDKWVSADAILAMKEAVAQSMGVPVDTIDVNYGDQLCESAPTLSPTRIPGRVRRNLLLESNSLPSSAPYPSAFSSDSKMGMVHRRIQEDETSQSRQLQFSVVLQLTGL
jgi:hypothetical protein